MTVVEHIDPARSSGAGADRGAALRIAAGVTAAIIHRFTVGAVTKN
jgi:hypothetical protein